MFANLKLIKYIIQARSLQSKSCCRQKRFFTQTSTVMPSIYPFICTFWFIDLSFYAVFALIWINDDTMARTENVHCSSVLYSV